MSLNLDSPRTRVAMKRLGIASSDLRSRDLADFTGSAEVKQAALDIFEQKRLKLAERVAWLRDNEVTAEDVEELELIEERLERMNKPRMNTAPTSSTKGNEVVGASARKITS